MREFSQNTQIVDSINEGIHPEVKNTTDVININFCENQEVGLMSNDDDEVDVYKHNEGNERLSLDVSDRTETIVRINGRERIVTSVSIRHMLSEATPESYIEWMIQHCHVVPLRQRECTVDSNVPNKVLHHQFN